MVGASPNPILSKLREKDRIRYTFKLDWENRDEMATEIRKGLNAEWILIAPSTFIETMAKDIPDLYKLDGYFAKEGLVFVMQRDWGWAEAVKSKFLDYGHSGFFDELERKFAVKVGASLGPDKANQISFRSLSDLFGITLCAGLGAAFYQIYVFWFERGRKIEVL